MSTVLSTPQTVWLIVDDVLYLAANWVTEAIANMLDRTMLFGVLGSIAALLLQTSYAVAIYG